MNTNQSVGAVGSDGDVSGGDRLSIAVGAFLAEKAAELSPYSVIHLRSSLLPLVAALSDPRPGAVTYAELRGYVDGLYLRYKPGTIRSVVGDIRQFWRWAKKKRVVAKNPAKRLKMPSARALAATASARAAGEEEVARLIHHLADSLNHLIYRDVFGNLCAGDGWQYHERQTLRDLFLIVLVYESGARIGEIRTLGSRAMNDALKGPGPGYSIVVTGKTSTRTVWFTVATAELWRLWQRVRPRGCDELAVVGWYPHSAPRPIQDRSTLSHIIARRCKAAGVAPFRAHALRHAKAKRATGVVGLEAASRLLDHSSTAVTARYAAIYRSELPEAAAKTGLAIRLWS